MNYIQLYEAVYLGEDPFYSGVIYIRTGCMGTGTSGNLGYLIQHEYFRFPDDTEPSGNYRVSPDISQIYG